MRRVGVVCAAMSARVLVAMGFVLAAVVGQTSPPAGGIAWQQDFAAARARAHDSGKPLLVTFRCEA